MYVENFCEVLVDVWMVVLFVVFELFVGICLGDGLVLGDVNVDGIDDLVVIIDVGWIYVVYVVGDGSFYRDF